MTKTKAQSNKGTKFRIKRNCFFDSVPMCLSAFVPNNFRISSLGFYLSTWKIILIVIAVMASICTTADSKTDYQHLRVEMVERQIRARGVKDERVLKAMEKVPRHKFIPGRYIKKAYGDYPLPIGEGQTISQPYIVAAMTELLKLKEGDKVLEIGTGSGYQAAILGEITREVYTIEIIEKLAKNAKETLHNLNYGYIKTKAGDGYFGWKEYAPFDAIIVTAAPSHIPPPLKKQLKDGGRIVIPVGMPGAYQTLWQITKHGDKFEMNNVMGVRFVPFTGIR